MAKGLKRLFKQGRRKNVTRKRAKAARSGGRKRGGGTTGSGTTFARIRRAIRRIPLGEVRTYGEVAAQVGVSVRTVVWALHNCPADVPWHRVIGKPDRILLADRSPLLGAEQANRLCQEGWIVRDWRVVRERESGETETRGHGHALHVKMAARSASLGGTEHAVLPSLVLRASIPEWRLPPLLSVPVSPALPLPRSRPRGPRKATIANSRTGS